ncbi:ABC transporter permease [Microtetraspora niveoalba]|uniref:ABC transporter permease n=1 Tax=Microtetraspora niveoalba TaxID=46175 RepID=UPI0014719EC5|nr:ABC transporter permease [Microtetraspora niveoalba]
MSEPLLLAAAFGSILLATTTLVALMTYAASVTDRGVRQAVETASLTVTSTTVTSSVRANDYARIDTMVRDEIDRGYASVPHRVVSGAKSDSYAMPGQEGRERPDLTRFATYDDLQEHADLVAGAWPSESAASTGTGDGATVKAALSEPAAEAMRVAAGGAFEVVGRLDGRTVKVEVTGVFRLRASDRDRWAGDELLRDGTQVGDYTTYGPLVVPAKTFLGRFATGVSASWMAVPDLGGLTREDLRPLAASVTGIAGALKGGCTGCTVSTGLPGMLTQLDRAALVARSTMLIPVLQLLVLAAYALTLTARLLTDHRRMEIALLRSRGAGSVRLAALAGGEALLVALPCAIAAPYLAPLLLALIGGSGTPLWQAPGVATFAVAVGVALACAVLLALPAVRGARRTYVEEQGARGRGERQGLIQRAGADLALLVVAALAIWQLQRYGAPVTETTSGDLGIDPLIVTGPALALLCGGLLGLRLVPLISRLLERVTARRPGFAAAVGVRQVSRRSARYSGPALLLTMAVAIGALSLATTATWRQSQDDQARHLSGADLRVTAAQGDTADGYASLPGVTSIMPVHRVRAAMGGGDVDLVAADAAKLPEVMLMRPDLSDLPLATLAARLVPNGPALPVVVTDDLAKERTLTVGTSPVPIEVVGTVRAMPGTPAGSSAVLADLSALRTAGKVPAAATEWWLAVSGDDTSAAAAALAKRDTDVIEIGALTRQLRDDPLAGGLRGALLLGFVAALAFAVLGFLVNAAVSARERRSEFALLGALGVGFRQMLGLLAVEQSFVIALSLVAGVLLAVIVAMAVVPSIVLTGQATAVTPSVMLDIPWPGIAALGLAVAAVLVVVVYGLARSLHRRGPGGVLRSGEDR